MFFWLNFRQSKVETTIDVEPTAHSSKDVTPSPTPAPREAPKSLALANGSAGERTGSLTRHRDKKSPSGSSGHRTPSPVTTAEISLKGIVDRVYNFYAPESKDRGHIVLPLSVRPSVRASICLSVQT